MSFDSLSLKILLLETKEQIIGRTVDKIMEHRSGEYGFVLRNETGPSVMLVSINPNFPAFFHTLEQKINFMNTQSNYQLLMKKYFEGARIVDIKTFHSDRILGIYLLKKDSFSETGYILFFEFMGKHSNSFIYQGHSLAPGSLDSAGVIGALNFSHGLCDYLNSPPKRDIALYAANLSSAAAPPGGLKELIASSTGLSPMLCKIAAGRPFEKSLAEIAAVYNASGYPELEAIIEKSRGDKNSIFDIYNPAVYASGADGKRKVFVYPFDPGAAGETAVRRDARDSLNECYALFYTARDTEFITSRLRGRINRLLDIAAAKKGTFESDLRSSADYMKYSERGALIISELNNIKAGGGNKKLESITIAGVDIPLDARFSVSDNAQRYFKLYKRFKAKYEYCLNMTESLDKIIEKIAACRDSLDSMRDGFSMEFCREIERRISLIASELIYEKRARKKFIGEFSAEMKVFASCVAQKSRAQADGKNSAEACESSKYYRLFKTEDGYLIYVGRSDSGNDYILSKIASQQDYWFHVKDFRGSSVILKMPKNAGDEALERALGEAALYAAHYSQGRNATKIFVSCAMRKYVKKVKRAAGKVIYSNERSILVDVNRLEEKFGRAV